MRSLYANFKFKVGDKVWIKRDGCPLQVEVKEKDFGRFGGQAYYVYLSEEKDEALKVYETEIASTKEELCDQQIKQCEEEIEKLEQSLVIAKNHKARWQAFKEEE